MKIFTKYVSTMILMGLITQGIIIGPRITHAEETRLFSVQFSQLKSIQSDVAGFNTAFAFTMGADENPEFSSRVIDLNPSVLRFPGGTLANYYHPDGNGYGMRKKEIKGFGIIRQEYNRQKNQSVNVLDEYISLAKKTGSKTLVVANVLYGTPQETLLILDKLKENNLPIAGVELGNELYFGEYRKLVPSVQNYIKRVQPFAEAIRAKYPDVKLGVIAAKVSGEAGGSVGSASFAKTWNTTLGQQGFYDAFIVHGYIDESSCASKLRTNFDDAFDCVSSKIDTYQNNYTQSLYDLVSPDFPGKEMWYTEWNIKSVQTTGNTFAQGAFITEMIMDMHRFNAKNNNTLHYASFHNLFSEGYGYGSLAFNKQNKTIKPTAAYTTFSLLKPVLQSGVQFVQSKDLAQITNTKFKAEFFYNSRQQKLVMVFVNKTGSPVAIQDVKGFTERSATIHSVSAEKLYANFGYAGFLKKYTRQSYPVSEKTEVFNGTVPGPYSYGVIEFSR